MPHPCPFCDSEFVRKCDLIRHQKTAKYCLELQREQGLEPQEETHKCPCGEIFTLKSNLNRHKATCSVATPGVTTINLNDNRVVNQQINLQIFGSTASALTPEIVAQKVLDVLSLEAVEKGLARMTEEVAPSIFTNEKNNWTIRVADGSRNKLVVRTDDGDQPDHQGYNTTRLLKNPFMEASILALEQTDRPKEVENTIEEIQDDDIYHNKTMGALLRVAPTRFNQTNSLIFTEAHRIAEEKTAVKLEKIMAKRKRKQAKQASLQAEASRNDMLDKAQDLHDGTFWHPIHHYIIQPDEEREFLIIGRRAKRGDTTLPLTKADIVTIRDLGLAPQLDAQYVPMLTQDARSL